jgi:hypothetical protein
MCTAQNSKNLIKKITVIFWAESILKSPVFKKNTFEYVPRATNQTNQYYIQSPT